MKFCTPDLDFVIWIRHCSFNCLRKYLLRLLNILCEKIAYGLIKNIIIKYHRNYFIILQIRYSVMFLNR